MTSNTFILFAVFSNNLATYISSTELTIWCSILLSWFLKKQGQINKRKTKKKQELEKKLKKKKPRWTKWTKWTKDNVYYLTCYIDIHLLYW